MLGRLNRNTLRLALPFILMASLFIQPVLAQNARVLESGASVTGVLDADTVA